MSVNDLAATERCVKCGLCLPHCPTFALTGNEADSPRGRISLMQMLDQAGGALSPGLFRHLDQCLQCQACEAMCPSNVPFGALMDTARARLELHRKRGPGQRLARKTGFALISSNRGRQVARALLNTYRITRLDKLIAAFPGIPASIKRRQAMLPPRHPLPAKAAARDSRQGKINLFTGCTGSLFDEATLRATQNLLTRLGYQVNVNTRQTCCGALHQHNGEPQTAAQQAFDNLAAFSDDSDPIIGFASGCTAHLKNYEKLYADAEAFSRRTIDIMHFLANRGSAPLKLKAFAEKVALLVPCTHRNALGQQASILQVLNWIPELNLEILNPQGGCCGAAGSYLLTQSELSGALGAAMAERFDASGARILLTTNIGCALQLRAATQSGGRQTDIMHPVTLIEQLLIDGAA